MKIHADALLFDNDGTLISSIESVNRCWARWAEEYGITEEEFARVELHGRPAAEIAADLLPAERVPGALARIEQLEVEDVAGEWCCCRVSAPCWRACPRSGGPW